MPQTTVAGHPLHPMLIVAPAALIPFGFIMDAMYHATGNESYANAAYYSLVGGLLGGLAAGTAGAMDYLAIERNTEVKRTANLHAALNGSAIAMTAVNVIARKDEPNHRGGSLLLSALSAVGVLVSGWFGGRLVYEQGMRVAGVSPVETSPELKPPGDDMMEHAFLRMEKIMPTAGPVLR